MNKCFFRQIFTVLFVGFLFAVSAENIFPQNSINGLILDRNQNPVGNIQVELLDEYERFLRVVKTSSAGIYMFQGLRAGNYYVQVRVDGTNYKPAKERIQVGQTNIRSSTTGQISGSESLQLNLVVEFGPRRSGNQTTLNNEVVFAQEIPDEAKKSYEKALKSFDEKKQSEGVSQLQTAVEIFPEYFLALDRLGYEFIRLNKFADAEEVFKKALETNSKSFSSKYGLSVSLYKLEKRSEAVKTLEEIVVSNPGSINSFYLLGKIYRELKEFENAEKNLKRAGKLSQNKLPDIHWELALLYYHNLGRYNDAADELELYLLANPQADNKKQVTELIKTFREKAKEKK